jgi:uncharacterized protein
MGLAMQGTEWSDQHFAPLNLLVIQASPFCNVDCSYCYLGDRLNRKRIEISTVAAAVRFVQDVPLAKMPLSVLWHAGEPMVVPMSLYERMFSCFSDGPQSIPVEHHFQTNATLLNDQWCKFIKQFGVRIGVSIDGPKEIHDAYRIDRSGRGTFDRVMRGIDKLREHAIPFSVISVITPAALSRPDEIWEFLSSLGACRLAFNVEEAEGAHPRSSLDGDDLQALTRAFFARIAARQEQTRGIPVRELRAMRSHLSAPPGSIVQQACNRPGAIINVDVNGNVTTLSPELLGQNHPKYGQFAWGNVHTDSWRDVMQHPRFLRAQQDVERGVQQCMRSCGYFEICGGGNPSNKLAELDRLDGTETQHCRLHVQAVADVVLEQLSARLARPTR